MKQTINLLKSGLFIAIMTATATTAYSEDLNSLNKQKSSLRDQKSVIEIENEKLTAENQRLTLQAEQKMLERNLQQLKNGDASLEIDTLSDPVFGEGLSKEDKLSFKKEKAYGKNSRVNKSQDLNTKDRKRRSQESAENALGDDKINIEALEERIKTFIQEEVNNKVKSSNITSNNVDISEIEPVNLEETASLLDLATGNNNGIEKENTLNPSDPKTNVKLVKIDIQDLVIFGETKKVKVLAKFEVKKNEKKEYLENIELDLEENQIYTYYRKVYLVEKITSKTIVLKNSTDNSKITQHL